jgi:hypothetical protein
MPDRCSRLVFIAYSSLFPVQFLGSTSTRPRKILIIAVPNEENKTAWENKLKENG